MAAKYRSLVSVKSIYDSSHKGYTNGVVNSIFMRKEAVAGVFNPPQPATQGSSVSGATPSLDLSAGTDVNLRVAVDGKPVVAVALGPVVGLTTGALIAANLESKINAALLLAGQDAAVWTEFAGGLYKIYSQTGGPHSKVVITNGATLNVADDLKLGTANAGVEAIGLDSVDYLLTTNATFSVSQDREMSKQYRNYQGTTLIRKKIMCEGEVGMYFNFDENAVQPVVDPAVELVLESIFGRKETLPGIIRFTGGDPQANYLSVQQIGSDFTRSMNGAFPKSITMSFPGDNIAEIKMPFKARNEKLASLGKVTVAAVASATLTLDSFDSESFEVGSLVMAYDTDGRTVLYGFDGSLVVTAIDEVLGTITVSSPISLAVGSYIGGYAPSQFGGCGLQAPAIGLQGAVSMDGGVTYLDTVRSAEISFDPKLEALDSHFGTDSNQGFVVSDKQEIMVKIEVTMTTDQFRYYTRTKRNQKFPCIIVLGDINKAHVKISCPAVEMNIPKLEIPESGTVAVPFEGKALATACGALDAFVFEFKGVGA